ncbi:hypothetical protein, partial [Thermobifida halotolerans]
MNHPIRPDPVFDPELSEEERALLRAHLNPPDRRRPPEAEASRRLPLPRWAVEHPVAAAVVAVLAVVVGLRLLARVAPFAAPLLLLTVVVAAAVVLLVAAFRTPGGGESPARAAARRYRDRYVTAEELDAEAGRLLVRAQRAAAAVEDARVVRDDVVDAALNASVLPHQLWETATALRRISDLRSRPTPAEADAEAAPLLAGRRRALEEAQRSVAVRVAALEDYAERVTEADRAHQRAQQLRGLLAEQEELRDLLAA